MSADNACLTVFAVRVRVRGASINKHILLITRTSVAAIFSPPLQLFPSSAHLFSGSDL